jgi:predicted kinase
VLIVMAGLPGSGKSTIAAAAARRLDCAVISVDPIEAAMWRAGIDREQPTGLAAYVAAEAVAEAQLRLGRRVIVDAVNDVEPARQQWRDLAARAGVELLFVEVVATEAREHRRRLEERERGIPGFTEPTWESVEARRAGFDGWEEARLRLDFVLDPDVNAAAIVAAAESSLPPATRSPAVPSRRH